MVGGGVGKAGGPADPPGGWGEGGSGDPGHSRPGHPPEPHGPLARGSLDRTECLCPLQASTS